MHTFRLNPFILIAILFLGTSIDLKGAKDSEKASIFKKSHIEYILEENALNNIADTDYITNYIPGAQTSQIESIEEEGGPKGMPNEVENSADFASDADAEEVLSSWKERYKGMGFEYKKSPSGAGITITADNGKKHVTKLSIYV